MLAARARDPDLTSLTSCRECQPHLTGRVNGQVRVAAGGQVKVFIPRLFSVLGQVSSCLGPCLSHPE